MTPTASDLDRARQDPAAFAEVLVGQPLWPHQLEVTASTARYRVICAGRRAGKTHLFGVLALHAVFSRPGVKVLIVSAGEVAAKRMFADIAAMAARSPWLRASVVDETKSLLRLSTGSQVECVPASMAQVRSAESDLLIVDEAAFVPQSIWEAAEPTVLARPGSRVLLCSTPFGSADHFFRVLWRSGMDAPGEQVSSWHWPSTVSPLVDEVLLEQIRERSSPLYFAREYLAEFVDEAGAFFRSEELQAAVDGFDLVDPDDGDAGANAAHALGGVVGGVDWGGRRDANALAVVGVLSEADTRGRRRFWVPFVEERFEPSYEAWIDRLVDLAGRFRFERLVSEENGVGQMPSQVLDRSMWQAGRGQVVQPVTTTARSKQDGFGFVRLLLQQGRLRLPAHPSLLKQLGALEYESLESGVLRISVPERVGHDDLAMALMLAVTPLMAGELAPSEAVLVEAEDLLWDDEGDPTAYLAAW